MKPDRGGLTRRGDVDDGEDHHGSAESGHGGIVCAGVMEVCMIRI